MGDSLDNSLSEKSGVTDFARTNRATPSHDAPGASS
jgi:hypothetical protein